MTMHDQSGSAGPPSVYVDRPEIAETFADFLEVVIFDGAFVRMEFVVNRFDPPDASRALPAGRKVTAARLVLPLSGAANLASQLESLLAAIRSEGGSEAIFIQSREPRH
jgi:hypothetical protein